MKTRTLSPERICRLREQGYYKQTEAELNTLAKGHRFAYQTCTVLLAYGVVMADTRVLAVLFMIALGGVVLPYHPFDYIYNYIIRELNNKPKLPPRSKQARFACLIATIWIGGVITCFLWQYTLMGYVLGGVLLCVAALVSLTDICIPSKIYNALFSKKHAI